MFKIDVGGDVLVEGPEGQLMHAGFISLEELHNMFKIMGVRLFDRNIRAPLARRDGSKSTSVNQKITETLRRIILDQTLLPSAFSFMHNGVTLYAQRLIGKHGQYEITEPRILNGAQTVATVAQFAERFAENPKFNIGALREVKVLCKIVANADDEFIRAVTVSTNRQNPVHPANLRANDPVQLQIADWLRENSFLYERQENSAAWQDPDELAEQGITADRVVLMKRLGETFAVTDGKVERARNMNQLFDSDQQYAETFHEGRTAEELGKVVLCYKCRTYCHNTLARELAVGRATFVDRAKLLLWALVCQGLLNQKDLAELVDEFGGDLRMPEGFRERLLKIALRQVKPTLLWLVQQKEFSAAYKEERYEFLRGDKAFNRSMSHVLQEYGWRQTRLGRPFISSAKGGRRAAAARV
jgi:AIPR protein